MVTKYNLDILYVDYIQLLGDAEKSDNREQEIASIVRRFSRLRKTFAIPIVLLAQLNRNCDARADGRPMLSDLRESGAIEAHADAVLLCYFPPVYGLEGDYELICAKHRHGPVGTIFLHWAQEQFKFDDSTSGVRIPRAGEIHRRPTATRKPKKEWNSYDKED
jgi:replicative DNA helicase